ncbi:MAG: hypothetical protein ACPGWR_08495 [Ardenticatenaceae bacterium]
MRSRLFHTLAIWLLLLSLFGAQYAAIVFSAASLPDVSASPDASIRIDGPANTHKNEEVTYTISYNDIPSTGGVQYQYPINAGFEIVTISGSPNTITNSLVWPYHTIVPTGTIITIVGKYTVCDTSVISVTHTHQATILDTHAPPTQPSEHSSSVETAVDCNERPIVSDVTISPATEQPGGEFVVPNADTNITVSYDYFDPDGDLEAQGKTEIRWTRDGVSPSALDDQVTIPSEEIYVEEKWCVTVRPHDGKAYGERSEESCAYIERIPNGLPEALGMRISPEYPRESDTLTVDYNYRDPNNDLQNTNEIEYRWYRDGTFQPILLTDTHPLDLSQIEVVIGEEWCVTVTPHDGKEHGDESEPTCTVIHPPDNRLPRADSAKITPTTPIDYQPLTLTYTYQDPDGHVEKGSQIQWYRNGLPQGALTNTDTISDQFTNAGEQWYATIRPRDDYDYPDGSEYFGPRVKTEEVLISAQFNTAPEATEAQIIPAGPGQDDRLRLTYKFVDAEGDPESESTIKWYRNGSYMAEHDGRTVIPPDATREGEKWLAKVTPNDGKKEGDEVEVDAVKILSVRQNIKPRALDPYLSRGIPGVTETLKLHYEYYDADGDPQGNTQIRWTVDGITNTSYNEQTLISSKETKVGEKWCATVTPHDGLQSADPPKDEEIPCVKIELVGRNTAPEARQASITPRPRAKDNLELDYKYFDLDNDPERGTRINWTVNGKLLSNFSGLTVIPATQTEAGEKWEATIKPNDNYDIGTAVVVSTTINTPPQLLDVRLMDDPALNQHLTPYYKYEDADGDPLDHLEVRWYKNKEHQPQYDDQVSIPAADTAYNETWHVIVAPHDGYEYGDEVRSNKDIIVSDENRYYFPFLPYSEDGPKIPRP